MIDHCIEINEEKEYLETIKKEMNEEMTEDEKLNTNNKISTIGNLISEKYAELRSILNGDLDIENTKEANSIIMAIKALEFQKESIIMDSYISHILKDDIKNYEETEEPLKIRLEKEFLTSTQQRIEEQNELSKQELEKDEIDESKIANGFTIHQGTGLTKRVDQRVNDGIKRRELRRVFRALNSSACGLQENTESAWVREKIKSLKEQMITES